ncbi:MAG: M14 family zinc carboxypeptidase [Planctomycetota bacterium]
MQVWREPSFVSDWEFYERHRVAPLDPSRLRSADVSRILNELNEADPSAMSLQEVGRSVEGRPLLLATLGGGPRTVLMWSQMHGDEATHTAVLLDLVGLLQRRWHAELAESILSGCTLYVLPMLNPDGAENGTRWNAQDVDVNRDALQLQSPEGRALRDVVNRLRPQFAFNLHNQNERTAVARTNNVAAVSLLAPPLDEQDTETEQLVRAKKVAACLLRAVERRRPGLTTRYDADYMPRCFGEWVQRQGTATVLMEAGGWPDENLPSLARLHFGALVDVLCEIAAERYLEADHQRYQRLPTSSSHRRFDLLVRNVALINGRGHPAFRADLGVNWPQRRRTADVGVICDLGDLRITGGKTVLEGDGRTCAPGRIVRSDHFTPARLPTPAEAARLIERGVTTLLVEASIDQEEHVDAIINARDEVETNLPLNVGVLVRVEKRQKAASVDRLIAAIAAGALAVVGDGAPPEWKSYLEWFETPVVAPHDLPSTDSLAATIHDMAAATRQAAVRLRLANRGAIGRNAAADLILIECDRADATDDSRITDVYVAGVAALTQGCLTGVVNGRWLRRNRPQELVP